MASCHSPSKVEGNGRLVAQLDSLFTHHEVFKGRRLFDQQKERLSEFNQLRFAAQIGNYFNAPQESNGTISRLVNEYSSQVSDSLKAGLMVLALQNHIRLGEYKRAATVARKLLTDHIISLDSTGIADLKNEVNIWEGLKDSPPQTVLKKEHSEIELVGGSKIPTVLNHTDSSINLIFDTGANFSVITASLAKASKLTFVGASCQVKGILGDQITADIALCESMKFGEVELANVVFLVFPDSALYIAAANFQIWGIVGYPVISALEEVQLTKEKRLIIPQIPSKNEYPNLALDFLTPIFEVIHQGDSMPFSFDSGASHTWLYEKYFRKYSEEIIKDYDQTHIRLGGIGGMRAYEGFYIQFDLQIGKEVLEMDSTVALLDNMHPEHSFYYGNLGQDVMNSFEKMTINFKDMFVSF